VFITTIQVMYSSSDSSLGDYGLSFNEGVKQAWGVWVALPSDFRVHLPVDLQTGISKATLGLQHEYLTF
jgi:hypothetical protein